METLKAIGVTLLILIILWQLISAAVYGLSNPDETSVIEDAKYNKELYKSGRANKKIIVHTVIDNTRKDPSTASGFVEHSTVIRDDRKK